jgi:hypothetical protein
MHCHHLSSPFPSDGVLIVRQTLPTDRRIGGITAQPISNTTSPLPNEMRAAATPSPSSRPSCPFSRDWIENSMPMPKAAVSPMRWCCCALRAGRISVVVTPLS